MSRVLALVFLSFALAACSSGPPTPAWQMSARSSLDASAIAWLEGRDAVESAEFTRARAAVARTGQLDLVARAELHRCALRVATLVFEPCSGFDALAADATPEDAAYARYLANRLQAGDAERLPAAHRAALAAADPASALQGVEDPITRLVAAGAALRRAQASPALVQLAVDTASSQGWPRPLLAWLLVQQRSAQAAGDTATAERLQRRIDAVAPRAAGR
ncbi:MAG TPA: hypothetical protein VLG41_22465 [Hydrogenophaga sp.]|uniref:hypothetical protein n=1 Tax=Hydrogenophaga sp. TaxID=1904254 RepID=UPI002CBC67F5|nr:hypothetical protein [Hydrogenophaga sp.]HSX95709.1 hypothetical protein [Hydrogenophaga sp.]